MYSTKEKDVSNLDQDLKISRYSKYDNPQLQKEVKDWLGSILGSSVDCDLLYKTDLLEFLKDGSVLCQLINKIWGNDSVKFKTSNLAFVQMENIEKFLNFCKVQGVPQDELFQTIDLYEGKDPYQVIMSLQSLSRLINKKFEGKYSLVGPSISKKHERPKVPTKPKNLSINGSGGVPWSSIEYGYMKGSNQNTEGVVFGARRGIISKKDN